jgi:hypothetical protein
MELARITDHLILQCRHRRGYRCTDGFCIHVPAARISL